MDTVNWKRISEAINFYTNLGFKYTEVPWLVPEEPYYVTKPPGAEDFSSPKGNLIASGEQSFIHMIDNGIKLEKSVCCTPCFRIEPRPDRYHALHFMKVELIDTKVNIENLNDMIAKALIFYNVVCGIPSRIEEFADGTYDIVGMKSGIELGSYGIRHWKSHSWIYGTGLAEPRTSQVADLEGIQTYVS